MSSHRSAHELRAIGETLFCRAWIKIFSEIFEIHCWQ